MQSVVAAKKISLLLSAGTVQFSTPAVDVTDDIKAELDRANPTVAFTPPAGWQPSQQTQQLLQQYQQLAYMSAMQRQRAAGGAAPAAAPAAGAKTPQGR